MGMIDAHIHLDHYMDDEITKLMADASLIEGLISVSVNLESCKKNLELSNRYSKVKAAFGYHPEQSLPPEERLIELLSWMNNHRNEMVAIGEVGLPYYLRKKQGMATSQYGRYIELLEHFVQKASIWEKPIVLHAVQEDAPIVCDLLEKYSLKNAHFHWFKGDKKTTQRMTANGYYISITPDVVYEEDIQQLVQTYPLEQMMIETDGPWPFEGSFLGQITHPNMMLDSIRTISKIKNLPIEEVSKKLLQNTKSFYHF
jgi:TatD DNase family protein